MSNNYALWAWVGPVTWIYWAVLVALVAPLFVRRPATKALVRGLAVALASLLVLLFALLPLGFWLIRPLEARFPVPDLRGREVTDIVVLAGAERLGSAALSGRLEFNEAGERVLEGAALARRFPEARLWIAGGVAQAGFPQTDVEWTAATWRRLGIPANQIVPVGGTIDTCGNALGYAARQGSRRPLLVTSAFHMPRSTACFRAAGLDPIPYPVDYRTWPLRSLFDSFSSDTLANLDRVDLAAHEWLGLLYYRLRGRTEELWPAS